jgi:hypothetical protein
MRVPAAEELGSGQTVPMISMDFGVFIKLLQNNTFKMVVEIKSLQRNLKQIFLILRLSVFARY